MFDLLKEKLHFFWLVGSYFPEKLLEKHSANSQDY